MPGWAGQSRRQRLCCARTSARSLLEQQRRQALSLLVLVLELEPVLEQRLQQRAAQAEGGQARASEGRLRLRR